MEMCPKCGAELSDGATECPACGIILAKFRPAGGASPGARPEVQPLPLRDVEPSTWPAAQPATPLITANTLAALHGARPWIGFMVVYGIIVSALMLLGGGVALIAGFAASEFEPLGLVYLVYGAVGFALVLPLRRSVQLLRQVQSVGPSAALEQFAVHSLVFWRRVGVLTVVGLVVSILALLLVAVLVGLGTAG